MNPAARRAARLDPEAAVRRASEWGLETSLVIPGSAVEFALAAREAAAEGIDLLFVAGGDGTLRLAAGELAGSPTALAAIPIGTANVWARETGIPSAWARAIDAHVLGQRITIDLGRAGDEPFILMAGIGWDAAIASRVRPGLKRRVGPLAYALEALRALPRLTPGPIDVALDGRDVHGDWGLVIVGNTRLYGGLVEFTRDALATDGRLDLVAIGPHRRGQGVAQALRLAAHRLAGTDAVYLARAATIDVTTPGLPLQLDGDVIGETPVLLCVDPGALRVSVPPGPLPPVLASPPNG